MRKKVIIVIVSVLVVLGGVGFFAYKHLFDRNITTADIHTPEDFFEFPNLVIDPGLNNNPSDTNPPATDKTTTEKETNDVSKSATKTKETKDNKQVNDLIKDASSDKEADIAKKYASTFVQLENMAVSKLDLLMNNAKQDLTSKEKTKVDIASIYMSAAKKLEKSVNGVFYEILDKMKKELSDAGLSSKMADQAEKSYKNTISKKKDEMMDKALKS
ncbi:hypothetical protein BVG16_06970 [Paenibacillus selenitireducens]|uniref:Uncharacterized protein n=1 Tax=Paenibacillus selenitireducens TaxID=1324314 RepID=A0A1T2XKY1_9BACL|nr:hypothetical protein [Paenibacillus selenitireducens]OPA80465.1 hypothetical protein BVG16_06970 [Paenibacillus selenitireducens]